ncbi:MAG TPA: flavin reductase family protein [Bacteroidia bacterium]|jgi:flavin reductase (DIM6/NTAB) family NADH-FMN oxidoreductase RutF|nr:flavin reductase family protein [Bacteroidia bacterium]
MLTIDPKEVKTPVLHSYLLGAVAPRPIAFASTIDAKGTPNLSPFSFFNVFSANPPIAIFSPALSGRTGLPKHTYENIKEVPEVVINVVNYNLVQQASLASTEYAKGVNEFEKAGLTPVKSELVKPFRVKESPAQLECKVKQVIELGTQGGAGNLIICEIVLLHISEDVLDDNKQIDPRKIDLVARLGGNWYSRTNAGALFEVTKPILNLGIGIDQLPEHIRNSTVLTGNNLGQLGNVEKAPSAEEVISYKNSTLKETLKNFGGSSTESKELHRIAKELLEHGKVDEAWKILLSEKI